MKLIEKNRKNIDIELNNIDKRKYFSPANYGDVKVTLPLIKKYCSGNSLDAGCGDMPYKSYIINLVTNYDTIDFEEHVPGITYIGDLQDMYMIKDDTYDTILCFEVLEHLPNPFKAVREIRRIIKNNGMLILSVPHLSRLHDVPHDYFRYTKFGLKALLEENGFEIVEIKTRGGIFSFLGHQFSNIFCSLFWHIPIIKNIVFFINKLLSVRLSYFLDKIFDKNKIFALGYTVVARQRNK